MKVLITNTIAADLLTPLEGVAEVILGPDDGELMPHDEVLALLPDLDAIINQAELQVDEALLRQGPKLKIVANVAMGTNNFNLEAMTRFGVWATNVPDAFTDSTADCTMGLLLGLARSLHNADRYTRSGDWQRDGFRPGVWDGTLLSGKTLEIIGYGRIGKAVAQRARAFGMQVIFNNRSDTEDEAYRPIDVLLQEADVVSLHTPLTDETRHLLDARRLSLMNPGALLINMARGPVIDEQALVQALQDGRIKGAALDVFEAEPRVHPALLEMPNVFLTPHIGGGTVESRTQARRLCVENVAAVLQGGRPFTPVNNPVRKS